MAAGVAAVEGVETRRRVATAAGVVGLTAQVAGLARARAVGVAAVRAAAVFARGRGTATLPLPTEDEERRRCSVGGCRDRSCRGGAFGSCDCRGAAAAFSVGDASGRRPKRATALPRASRLGPAEAQSRRI